MPEIVGELKIDFDVIQSTVQTLWIGDRSDWLYAEELPAYIYITMPGSRKEMEYEFTKNQICVYNSHNLGINCKTGDCENEAYIDLPDGIYTITLKSGYTGFEKTHYYLKTDKTELELSKLIVSNSLEYSISSKDFRNSVYDIEWMIKVGKSAAKIGDFPWADRHFKIAKKDLEKLSDCKDCI